MKRRYIFFGAAAILLAALNVWRWWTPTAGRPDQAVAPRTDFRTEDFQLKMTAALQESSRIERDLFSARLPPPPPAIPKVEAPPPAPPGKTPEQIAEEAARAELAQIKLIGVVFRGEKGEAFVAVRDHLQTVRAGERIGGRFYVEAVRQDSIQLKDPVTQVGGQIPISGK